MSNIFDEKEDLKSIRNLVHKLRELYLEDLKKVDGGRVNYAEIDNVRIRQALATSSWPGDEIVGQLIRDTLDLMMNNNIDMDEIK